MNKNTKRSFGLVTALALAALSLPGQAAAHGDCLETYALGSPFMQDADPDPFHHWRWTLYVNWIEIHGYVSLSGNYAEAARCSTSNYGRFYEAYNGLVPGGGAKTHITCVNEMDGTSLTGHWNGLSFRGLDCFTDPKTCLSNGRALVWGYMWLEIAEQDLPDVYAAFLAEDLPVPVGSLSASPPGPGIYIHGGLPRDLFTGNEQDFLNYCRV